MSTFGVLYFVDQNPFVRRMLDASLASLRRFHPDWPVHIVEVPSPPVGIARALYRRATFWKRRKRFERGGRDMRVVAAKTDAWLQSPFELTLYLDADTVVLQALDGLRARASAADVLACPLPWKQYAALEPWQPARFPYVMAGVAFFNRRFREAYAPVVARFAGAIDRLPTADQFVFSLFCAMQRGALRIAEEPTLQFDVINMQAHAGQAALPLVGDKLDLRWPGLGRFHIFHYNEHKPYYLDQAQLTWMQPADAAAPRKCHHPRV